MVICYAIDGRLRRYLPIILLNLLFSSWSYAANIDVAVDRNPVGLNESFQLTFTASETPDDDPDFSPLQKDFEILNQQQSSQSSWVNGSFSKTVQWTLTLMAKQPGKLTVPAIVFGNDLTSPLDITVTQAVTSDLDNGDLFLEVDATPKRAYVQSQILFTLRFYRRVQITQASLTEPELDNAVVEKLGEDKNYNTQINGVNYAVTERKYAIFPQQSGEAQIGPLVLTAQVVSSSRSRFNGFFNSQVTNTQRVSSRKVVMEVLPAPDKYRGDHWLPAEQVYLEEKWSNPDMQVKVGEPLTRTLTILAKGTTVSQLPELNTKTDQQLKTYPDQPSLKEQKTEEGLIAFREQKIAFIPSTAGQYKLPAIEIPWFNTKTGQTELARLPSVTLTATGTAATPVPVETPAPKPAQQPATILTPETSTNSWQWLSLFLACGWLLTILFFLRQGRRDRNSQHHKKVDKHEERITDMVKTLKKACEKNDPQVAKQALMAWGKFNYNTASLGAIAPFCEARLRDEILRLNHCLYSMENCDWDGKKLFQAFAENKARNQIETPKTDTLEPLFRI